MLALFCMFDLGQKFDFKKLLTLLTGIFLIEVTFLSYVSTFFRYVNHHWKCREQKENFQEILIIIFWNFTIFQYRSNSPQVKGTLISSIANLVYELPNELPNDFRLRILGNIRKISNLSGCIA